jgi:hypothetical protein
MIGLPQSGRDVRPGNAQMTGIKQRVLSVVSLRIGDTELAVKKFGPPDDAASWLLSTADRLRGALDSDLYTRIETQSHVEIVATIAEDGFRQQVPVFSGSLAAAVTGILPRVRDFEARSEEFHRAAVKEHARLTFRRMAFQAAAVLAGAAILTTAYVLLRSLPPLFDIEAMSNRLLSAPQSNFAGSWNPASATDPCEENRIEFSRGQVVFVAGGRPRVFNANFSSPNDWSMRVEYTDSGVQIAKMLRLAPDQSSFQVLSITASDSEIQTTVRRMAGTRFYRCSHQAKGR